MKYLLSINRLPLIEKPGADFDWPYHTKAYEPREVTALELLERIGKGFAFTAIFDDKPALENFISAQHICVDMDTEGAESSLAALENHPLVAAHGALIYPTHSHRPEAPRHRVVFLLDEPIYGAEAYRTACQAVNYTFPGTDPASCNPAQVWQANGKIDFDNLWGLVYKSPHFSFDSNQLMLYIAQFKRAQARLRDSRQRESAKQFDRQTHRDVMPMTELFQKLAAIDSYSLPYDQWVKLGAAIAHTYGDAAFFPFKQWSDKEGKTPVAMGKWRSLIKESNHQAGYGTIVMMLKGAVR